MLSFGKPDWELADAHGCRRLGYLLFCLTLLPQVYKDANESTVNLYVSVLFVTQCWSPSTALPHSDHPWDIKLKDFISTGMSKMSK